MALSFAVAKSVNNAIIIDIADKYIIFSIIYEVFRVEEIKTRVLVIFKNDLSKIFQILSLPGFIWVKTRYFAY